MSARGIVAAAVIVGVVLMPLAGTAQMGPGKGTGGPGMRGGGGGGPMMMQGMMQQMQGMMKEMAEMMKGGAMTPEQQ